MQTIELGNAQTLPITLVGDAYKAYVDASGEEPTIIPRNTQGQCVIVTDSSEFANYFEDVILAQQAG